MATLAMIACPEESTLLNHEIKCGQTESSSLTDADATSTSIRQRVIARKSKWSSRYRRKRCGAHEGERQSIKRERVPIPSFAWRINVEGESAPAALSKATNPSDPDTYQCSETVPQSSTSKDSCVENYDASQQTCFSLAGRTSQINHYASDEPTSVNLPTHEITINKNVLSDIGQNICVLGAGLLIRNARKEATLETGASCETQFDLTKVSLTLGEGLASKNNNNTLSCTSSSDNVACKSIALASCVVSESNIKLQSTEGGTATHPRAYFQNDVKKMGDNASDVVVQHRQTDDELDLDAIRADVSTTDKLNESCFPSAIREASQIIDLCSDERDTVLSRAKGVDHSRSQYFSTLRTGLSNVTNCLHNEYDVRQAVTASSNAIFDRKNLVSKNASDKDELRERRSSVRRRTEMRPRKESGKCVAKKKQSKSAGKKLCAACSTCDCSSTGTGADGSLTFPAISESDARHEQSLINRLKRLEREIVWKEGQRYDITRALKKHQTKMLKTWGDLNSVDQKPRFLADVEFSDDVQGSSPNIHPDKTTRAQKRVFGKLKTEQPTLTQMIRDHTRGDNDNLLNDAHDSSSENNDFLSIWTTASTPQESRERCSSMSVFRKALANCNDVKSIDHWAKATANTLREEDQGFDALVSLFDESMEKNYSSNCCSSFVNDYGSENMKRTGSPLSPGGKQLADQIVLSVKDDSDQLAAIERMCPSWVENVRFAQNQTNPNILQNALRDVKQASVDLDNMKDRIIQAFMDRRHTLELYAKSIQVSYDRSLKDRLIEK